MTRSLQLSSIYMALAYLVCTPAMAAGEVSQQALQASYGAMRPAGQQVVERPQVIRSISETGGDSIMALELIRFVPRAVPTAVTAGRTRGSSPYPRSTYFDEISYAVAMTGVDEALIRSVIHAESAYQRDARSRVGAEGLMQLMPATARRFGVTNSFDPAQNILGGATYLKWLLTRYGGDMYLAVAAYNAGEGAVDRHGGIPPYTETKNYVSRVTSLFPQYQQMVR